MPDCTNFFDVSFEFDNFFSELITVLVPLSGIICCVIGGVGIAASHSFSIVFIFFEIGELPYFIQYLLGVEADIHNFLGIHRPIYSRDVKQILTCLIKLIASVEEFWALRNEYDHKY